MALATALEKVRASSAIEDGYLEASKHSEEARRHDFRRRSRKGTQSDLLDVLKKQQRLEATLSQLRKGYEDDSTCQPETSAVSELFEMARCMVEETKELAIANLDWDPVATMPSARSSVTANRVFEVPELVEMIITDLPAKDILAAAQSFKAMSRCVLSSTKVQAILGLRCTADGFFQSKFFCESHRVRFAHLPGLRCTISTRDDSWSSRPKLHNGKYKDEVTISASFETYERPPKIGSRGRAMLVCQPPLLEMQVSVSCCSSSSIDRPLDATQTNNLTTWTTRTPAKSTSGITVGDLLDITESLQQQHRVCPFAGKHSHDLETGDVRVS